MIESQGVPDTTKGDAMNDKTDEFRKALKADVVEQVPPDVQRDPFRLLAWWQRRRNRKSTA